jgi:hypothetical protein
MEMRLLSKPSIGRATRVVGRWWSRRLPSHGHIGVFGCDFQPTQPNPTQPDRGGREEEEFNSPAGVGAVMAQNGEASGFVPEVLHHDAGLTILE